MRALVDQYFGEHPKARDGVLKAYYAYGSIDAAHRHAFRGLDRGAVCMLCGRSREQVRWDDLPAPCQFNPNIEATIRAEEERAFDLAASASDLVPKIIAKRGMSGDTLAFLHHTHGLDPETVAAIVTVPVSLLASYHEVMERERARSRAEQKKVPITVSLDKSTEKE